MVAIDNPDAVNAEIGQHVKVSGTMTSRGTLHVDKVRQVNGTSSLEHQVLRPAKPHYRKVSHAVELPLTPYSTVTDFARFLGWSTSQPRRTAM